MKKVRSVEISIRGEDAIIIETNTHVQRLPYKTVKNYPLCG